MYALVCSYIFFWEDLQHLVNFQRYPWFTELQYKRFEAVLEGDKIGSN